MLNIDNVHLTWSRVSAATGTNRLDASKALAFSFLSKSSIASTLPLPNRMRYTVSLQVTSCRLREFCKAMMSVWEVPGGRG